MFFKKSVPLGINSTLWAISKINEIKPHSFQQQIFYGNHHQICLWAIQTSLPWPWRMSRLVNSVICIQSQLPPIHIQKTQKRQDIFELNVKRYTLVIFEHKWNKVKFIQVANIYGNLHFRFQFDMQIAPILWVRFLFLTF